MVTPVMLTINGAPDIDGLTDDARRTFWITVGLEHRGVKARRRR